MYKNKKLHAETLYQSTAVNPMFRLFHKSRKNLIPKNILQLLPHHLQAPQSYWMILLLPDLKLLVVAIPFSKISEQFLH
jgi:hypothetical protein